MDILRAIVLAIVVLCFGYLIFEKIYYNNLRKKFKLVIHVNGISSMTNTTVLIDAGLRNCGFKVFTYLSGISPSYINTNNEEIKIKVYGNITIKEQLKMMKKAYKEHAEILIFEGMTTSLPLKKISAEQIIKADIAVITSIGLNYYLDKNDLDNIAAAIAICIPKNGILVVSENEYKNFENLFKTQSHNKNSVINVVKPYTKEENFNTSNENVAEALAICQLLNLNIDSYLEGMRKYKQRLNIYRKYLYHNTVVIDAFTDGDFDTNLKIYNDINNAYNYDELTVLLSDGFENKVYLNQNIEMLNFLHCKKIILLGSSENNKIKNIQKQYPDIDFIILKRIDEITYDKIILALGKYNARAKKIIDYLKKNGEKI